MEKKDLEDLHKGDLLFVNYIEDGKERNVKGNLESITDSSIIIRTFRNLYYIALNSVTKIKKPLNEEDEQNDKDRKYSDF